jgi:uncharacterized RDD family membrane protein YckC
MTEQPSEPTAPPAPPDPAYGQAYGQTGYPVAQYSNTQVLPVPPEALASPGKRFGGMLLTFLLIIVTLVIGYLIWALVVWSKSTTPAKQILGMRIVDSKTGQPLTYGGMVMRQVVWALVLGIGSGVTFYILGIVDAFFVFSGTRQRLLDKMAGTLVVNA